MVKDTQTICRQEPKNSLSVFDHFVELALKGLNNYYKAKGKHLSKIKVIGVVVWRVVNEGEVGVENEVGFRNSTSCVESTR